MSSSVFFYLRHGSTHPPAGTRPTVRWRKEATDHAVLAFSRRKVKITHFIRRAFPAGLSGQCLIELFL